MISSKVSDFQFKEFRIQQRLSGMKVSTDACLFGALIKLQSHNLTILDIGAGTGLLSLILAQRTNGNSSITALEIDHDASIECGYNFQQSPWAEQLQILQQDVRSIQRKEDIQSAPSKGFNLILSNPPFFHNTLNSSDPKRNMARHSESLSPDELLQCIATCLSAKGDVWILSAYSMASAYLEAAKTVLPNHRLTHHIQLKSFKHKAAHCVILHWAVNDNAPIALEESNLIIYNELGKYTDDFIELMTPYYAKNLTVASLSS